MTRQETAKSRLFLIQSIGTEKGWSCDLIKGMAEVILNVLYITPVSK